MSNDRRVFLKQAATLAGAFSAASLFNQVHAEEWKRASKRMDHLDAAQVAQDEDYWSIIQNAYTVSPEVINLNNGGVSPSPLVVQQAVARLNDMANLGPSYWMWRVMDQGREPLREKLADLAGVSPEEVAVNRNSTEALKHYNLWPASAAAMMR